MHITLNELMDKVSSIILSRCKEVPDGSIPPTFFVVREDGELGVMITPWENEHEKDVMLTGIERLFAQQAVVSYCMVSEAWMSKACLKEGTVPSKSSDRIEVVILTGSSRTETVGKALRIIRDANGEISSLEPMKENEGIKAFGGRLTKLLSKQTVH